MRWIYPVWIQNVSDTFVKRGSPYSLCRARSLWVPEVQHCSKNDVETVQSFLIGTHIWYSNVLAARFDEQTNVEALCAFDGVIRNFPLYVDTDTRKVHRKGCPKLVPEMKLKGIGKYKICIHDGYLPCSCCQKEYWEENQRLQQEIIKKSGFNYVFCSREKEFHRPSCTSVIHIPFRYLKGAVYYDTCIAWPHNKVPCEICKPTRDNERAEMVYSFHEKAKDANGDESSVSKKWHVTRKLTEKEKTAYRRYTQAYKERENLLAKSDDLTNVQLQDVYTLTQSRYAFWAAIGYETFHVRECPKLRNLTELQGYSRYREAIWAGLKPCKLCRPTPERDIKLSIPMGQRERSGEAIWQIDAQCDKYGFEHSYEAPIYTIKTPEGKWQLNTTTRPVDVCHFGTVEGEYHKQPRIFLSLHDAVRYIYRHDIKD